MFNPKNCAQLKTEDGQTFLVVGTSPGGFCDVYIQDQTTDIVDLLLCRYLGEVELASDAEINTRTATFLAGHGFQVGESLCMRTNGNWYQGRVVSVSGNDVTFGIPFGTTFPAGTTAQRRISDMRVNGSEAPVSFFVGPGLGHKWDITRMFIVITSEDAMDDEKFGSIAELANGIVIRAKKGDIYENIFSARSNGDLGARTSDLQYTIAASPGISGRYGIQFHRAFAGQDRNGVAIRLDGDPGDFFEILIQDDISTGLSSMKAVVQGHQVEE